MPHKAHFIIIAATVEGLLHLEPLDFGSGSGSGADPNPRGLFGSNPTHLWVTPPSSVRFYNYRVLTTYLGAWPLHCLQR